MKTQESIDAEIDNEIALAEKSFKMAAITNPAAANTDTLITNVNNSTKTTGQTSGKTSVKLEEVAKEETPSAVTGSVEFTMARDSNVNPSNVDTKATSYQIAPSLSFKSGNFGASISATIKDYAEQQQSDMFKQNEAKANMTYTANLTKTATSTSAISGVFLDERSPDYIGLHDWDANNPEDRGMPVRYADSKFEQKLGFNFESIQTELGGSVRHRDALSLYSDFASNRVFSSAC